MSKGLIPCVFVCTLDKVVLRYLPAVHANGPSFRIPRRPVKFMLVERIDVDWSAPSSTIDHFDRRGKMYDGTPIFVAEGLDVKEVFNDKLITKFEWFQLSQEGIMNTLRNETFDYARARFPEVRELDRWEGDIPLPSFVDQNQQIIGRRVRLIVAVRKPK